MYIVFLEIIIHHQPFVGAGCGVSYVAHRTIQLPFVPVSGMGLTWSDMGEALGSDFRADAVIWDLRAQRFACSQILPIADQDELADAADDLADNGWTVELLTESRHATA